MIYISSVVGADHIISEDAVLVGQKIFRNDVAQVPMMDSGFVCVADGVGGNNGGEKASQFVLELLSETVECNDLYPTLVDINNSLLSFSSENDLESSMATTLTGIYLTEGKCKLFHVGNTRLYVKQGNYLKQLTSDHTTYNWLRSIGQYEAAEFCNKSEITNCFGGGEASLINKLHVTDIPIYPLMILTSDGIHEYLDTDTLEEIICGEGDYASKCNNLIHLALDRGSIDDMTVVIIDPEA